MEIFMMFVQWWGDGRHVCYEFKFIAMDVVSLLWEKAGVEYIMCYNWIQISLKGCYGQYSGSHF